MSGLNTATFDFSTLDVLDSGAIVLDAQHRIRHWNTWMAQSSGLGSAALTGRRLWEALPSLEGSYLQDAVESAVTDGLPCWLSDALHGLVFPLRCPDDTPLLHNVIVRRLEHGSEALCLLQIHDVTARRRAEAALRGSEQRVRAQLDELETIYRSAPIGLALFDRDLRFLRINEALAEMNGLPASEHLGRNAWEVVPTLREVAEPLFLRVFETGEPIRGIELHGTTAAQPGVERDWIEDFYPLKDPNGSVVAVGVIVREVTEQRRLEERERLLMSELRHRIKNMFTMVEALAYQTARTAPSLPEFTQIFGRRLQTLAAAQDLLMSGDGQDAVMLSDLARVVLAPFIDADRRVSLKLDEVAVSSDVASNLALALHELGTNATKYGALSEHGGRITLTGRSVGTDAGPELHLEWRESDGPTVARPNRQGFGTRLLERAIKAQPGGRLDMDWRETGLVCRIAVPHRP